MREIAASQICCEALFLFSLLITILLKDRVRSRGIVETDTGRGCELGKGVSREKLWGELGGPLAEALRVIDKIEEVM